MIVLTASLTLHTLYLPLPPFSSSPFSYPCPHHRPVCYPAHGHTGVFQNNFLWHKLLALILQLTLFTFLSLHCSFPVHFLQHPLPKKCTLFSAGQLSKKSFFPLFPLLQFFIFLNEPCQLFISKELNHPANPCHVVPLVLLGEREIRRLTTPVYDSPSEFTNFQIQIPFI